MMQKSKEKFSDVLSTLQVLLPQLFYSRSYGESAPPPPLATTPKSKETKKSPV